jgi:hypothetical protein
VRPWTERSPETAALFNPAFCGVLLYSAVKEYGARTERPMPYASVFLVLPIVLHRGTRASLPSTVASPFHSWVHANPTIRIGLAERVQAALPITREALLYLLNRDCIAVEDGGLTVGSKRAKMTSKKVTSVADVREAVRASASLGRLLAGAGSTATLYIALGITP